MKIQLFSDLHAEFFFPTIPPLSFLEHTDADVIVFAGDFTTARGWQHGQFLRLLEVIGDKEFIFVLGNHDFYGGSRSDTVDFVREYTKPYKNVHFLYDDIVVIKGVTFIGTSLWTDFHPRPAGLSGKPLRDWLSRFEMNISDFFRIRDDRGALITPSHMISYHSDAKKFLKKALESPDIKSTPTVVVTHWAPHLRSTHPRFRGNPLNPYFINDMSHFLNTHVASIDLWIHGHTHDSFDYKLGDMRVVANPCGYIRDNSFENPSFTPGRVVTLEDTKP